MPQIKEGSTAEATQHSSSEESTRRVNQTRSGRELRDLTDFLLVVIPQIEEGILPVSYPAMPATDNLKKFRIFVATWNVGGIAPRSDYNLDNFLQVVHNRSDIYVLGFQGTVLFGRIDPIYKEVSERWRSLIKKSLSRSSAITSLDTVSSSDSRIASSIVSRSKVKASSNRDRCSEQEGTSRRAVPDLPPSGSSYMKYAEVQTGGVFLVVWVKRELARHMSQMGTSWISSGVIGLGNKGCVSIRFSLCGTSFCFICSHLPGGEKEQDKSERNYEVINILKKMQFPQAPHRILDHDRIIWLGDFNYKIDLEEAGAQKLLEMNDRNGLLAKDQLKTEMKAGGVFEEWSEGKIFFPPTYKYSSGSKRTPAWYHRILWRGEGIQQLSYASREKDLSGHMPVSATFLIEVVERPQGSNTSKESSHIDAAARE